MSIRTIIEINHDRLHELQNDPEWAKKLYNCLCTRGWVGTDQVFPPPDGARVLTDRHHSGALWIGHDKKRLADFS